MLNYIFKSNREVIIIKTNETQDKNIFLVKNNLSINVYKLLRYKNYYKSIYNYHTINKKITIINYFIEYFLLILDMRIQKLILNFKS